MAAHSIQSPDLFSIRRKKGISLAQISQRTKINPDYLEAIEEGNFTKLPGGIYSVSYIRQYARAIDYDEEDLLDCYYRQTGQDPDLALAIPPQPARRSFVEAFRSQLLRVLG